MRSIYLLIAFIGATTLFFYTFGSFTGQSNLFGNNDTIDNLTVNKKQPVRASSTGTKSFFPSNFGGPKGQPFIIGPQGPPPNY
ncbi:MAG: hypothetical protein Q8O66_02910 [bacterium]|nr:hypothetical protein [bacterium]